MGAATQAATQPAAPPAVVPAAVPALVPALDDRGAWRPAQLPQQKLPETQFRLMPAPGSPPVLRIESKGSYGNLAWRLPPDSMPGASLAWRWRVEQPLARADLSRREGDDAVVKLCASFDLPLEQLPFAERQKLRLARLISGEPLPAATLCYVWDARLAPGTVLANAYTRRVRWWVLRGPESPPGEWRAERRDLQADFLRAFGDEATRLPPLVALIIGADADNTGGQGVAELSELRWER